MCGGGGGEVSWGGLTNSFLGGELGGGEGEVVGTQEDTIRLIKE